MRKRRSSTSSSETLSLQGTPAGWWLSIAMAAVLVLAAELVARTLLGPGIAVPDYWDDEAGEKYQWYLDQPRAPRVLIMGDSSAARNYVPAAMEETLDGMDAFNLGTPGNFPLAIRQTAYRLLERESAPAVVVLSQAIHAFYDSQLAREKEDLIIGSRATRYLNGRLEVADHVFLARLYDHRFRAVQRLRGRAEAAPSPPAKGFMPHLHTGIPMLVPDGYFSDAPPSPERLQSVVELARLAADRGIKLVVAPPVQLDRPAQGRIEHHRRWLLEQADSYGFAVLDLQGVTRLTHDDFADIFHLSPEGAQKQSRALGAVLAECLPRPAWRACLADREAHPVPLVDGPRWIPEPHDVQAK